MRVIALALAVMVVVACGDAADVPGAPSADGRAERPSSSRDVPVVAGRPSDAPRSSGDSVPSADVVRIKPPVDHGDGAHTPSISSALPDGPKTADKNIQALLGAAPALHRQGQPEIGVWAGDGFAPQGDGFPAFRVRYYRDKASVIGMQNPPAATDAPPSFENAPTTAIRFEQSADLVVVVAGESGKTLFHEIKSRLEADGWASDSLRLFTAEGDGAIPLWHKDKKTIYAVVRDNVLIYAAEEAVTPATGGGRFTSFGAQKIIEFMEAAPKIDTDK